MCHADSCLYLSGVPAGVTDAAIEAELGRYGRVEAVVNGAAGAGAGGGGGGGGPLREELYVLFASVR